MAKVNLEKIMKYQPKSWPSTSENYFTTDQVPYLKKVVAFLNDKGFTKDQILEAWGAMLSLKADEALVVKENRVYLEVALYAFFAPVDYHKTKQHYAALLDLIKEQ